MNIKNFFKNKKVIYWSIFFLYGIINLIFVLLHEPWRDELHAWIMAKNLSIPELISESRFDGHPVLWHLILMPFAKLDFPIITLNLISYIIILISVWLFLFKTKSPIIVKIFATFLIPFTYTYNAISRNYCLILFFLVIIAIMYPKRFKTPILYSIPICFLIHTHSLAWGLVAGLTITFHFSEIYLWFKNKSNNSNIKHVIIGLILIALNTIFVVLELFGSGNPLYSTGFSNVILNFILIVSGILAIISIFTFFVFKSNYKELAILFFGFAFQICVYLLFYSSILFQRQMLIYVLLLFYIMLIFSDEKNLIKSKKFAFSYLFIIACIIFGLNSFLDYAVSDITKPFSTAIEMSNYIKENVPKNSTILVIDSVIGQSLIPYLGDDYILYDIEHNIPIDCANVYHDFEVLANIVDNINDYSGNYILTCNNSFDLSDSCTLLYNTFKTAIIHEDYTLYYIP